MAIVRFTRNLQRHVVCPPAEVTGPTVRAALEDYFARHPLVRSYVLDDEGAVRQHVTVFVGDRTIEDRRHLTDPVGDGEDIYVMQALSGGAI